MAFVSSPLPEEQQNQFAPSGTTTPNPLALLPPQAAQTGGSAGQGGGGQGGTAPSAGTPTQFGSNASKLSDYLAANQDQVQGMANQVAGGLNSQYSGLQGGINSAAQQFGGQVASGYTPQDPTIVSQAAANPSQFVKDPNNVSSFQQQLNDTYSGPKSFEGSTPYANVQEGVSNAVQQAGQLSTYPGLSTYLQNNYESNATPGQNTLDTVLLQGNQPAFQTVQQAAAPFAGLPGFLADTAKTQNQGVQAAQQAAPAAQQAAQAALQGQEQALTGNLNQELSGAQQGYQNYGQKANDLISQLSQPATNVGANLWGGQKVDPNLINALAGLKGFNQYDPNEAFAIPQGATYLNQAPPLGAAPTLNDVATSGDVANAQALQLLSGGSYQAPVSTPGNFALPDLPTVNQGAMGTGLYNMLINGPTPTFTSANNANMAQTDYKQALTDLQAYLNLPSGGGGGGFIAPQPSPLPPAPGNPPLQPPDPGNFFRGI